LPESSIGAVFRAKMPQTPRPVWSLNFKALKRDQQEE
jgi:hypothetical protein